MKHKKTEEEMIAEWKAKNDATIIKPVYCSGDSFELDVGDCYTKSEA